jgi:hypothetical protein
MLRNYTELINELASIEMDEACHNDYPEEYDSKLEFYLSNAQKESYIDYIMGYYNIESEKEAKIIQAEVISEIKRRYEAIQKAAAALGRKGGKAKTERKAEAARENGKKGGRPRKEAK